MYVSLCVSTYYVGAFVCEYINMYVSLCVSTYFVCQLCLTYDVLPHKTHIHNMYSHTNSHT